MVTRGAAQMEDSIPAGPNDGRKGYLFSLFGNPTLPFSTLTQKDSLGPSSNPPPFDPSSTQHSNPQLQEAAPCPGIHCSFREAMLFHKNAKGSLEPGTDPAPPTNWRSPVEAIVTPPPERPCRQRFLVRRPLPVSSHHPPILDCTHHPSPERQEQRVCETRSPLRPDGPAIDPLSARRPLGRRGRDTWGSRRTRPAVCRLCNRRRARTQTTAKPNERRATNLQHASRIPVHTD